MIGKIAEYMFNKKFQSVLKLGPGQRTLKIFSKCVMRVHQHFYQRVS